MKNRRLFTLSLAVTAMSFFAGLTLPKLQALAPVSWKTTNIVKGSSTMLVYATVTGTNGVTFKDTNSVLAAFSSNSLVGLVKVSTGPSGPLYQLSVNGTDATTTINYNFYNSATGKTYNILTNSAYVADGSIGTLPNPVALALALPLAPPKAQTITFALPTTKIYSSNATFNLVATAPGGVVTFLSSNTNILSISGATATMKAKGTVRIKASQAGNNNYSPATVTKPIILR
jgi:hypothetical protein